MNEAKLRRVLGNIENDTGDNILSGAMLTHLFDCIDKKPRSFDCTSDVAYFRGAADAMNLTVEELWEHLYTISTVPDMADVVLLFPVEDGWPTVQEPAMRSLSIPAHEIERVAAIRLIDAGARQV